MASFNKIFGELWRIPQEILDTGDDERLLAFVLDQLTSPDLFIAKVKEVYSEPDLESFDTLEFKDGRVLERSSRPQQIDGEIVGRVWSFRDITDRRRAEEDVRRLKNYLANIIDSMPSILVGIDRRENVTQWNRMAETATGISAAQALGQPLRSLLPEFAPWIDSVQGDVLAGHPASREKLLIVKEGEHRFYDLILYPLMANGVEGGVVRIEDATERVRIQELMIQTEKMMSVGGLAGGMAHEINNPLGIITQAAQNIERRVAPDLPANQAVAKDMGLAMESLKAYFQKREIFQFIQDIRDASARAAGIVSNMLQFSRKSEAIKQPAQLADVLDRSVALASSDYDLKKAYDFRNIDIVREYDPDIPFVSATVVELEQVILNLVRNAAQAMAANPPERKPRITLRVRRDGKYAVVEVEDNGPGMSEAVRRRVFEPFFTTKEPGVGTGLGLSVSYTIITQNHGGLIAVESSPGNGARFIIQLPLQAEAET